MNRRVYAMALLALILGISGCGKKSEAEKEVETVERLEESDESAVSGKEEKEPEVKKEALEGVYSVGNEKVLIPMGTCFDGGQKEYLLFSAPDNYLIAATYYENDENTEAQIFEMADGGNFVSDAVENGLLEQEYKIRSVLLSNTVNASSEKVIATVVTSKERSFDGYKELAGKYEEFASEEYPAFYYVDANEYATTDLCLCYAVNPDITVYISYEGPLADELGLEQLAHNLYDLVEVIE